MDVSHEAMERHADYRAVTTGGRDGKEAGVAKAIHAHAQGGSSATIYLDHRAEDRTFDDEPRATGTFTFPPAAENSAAELIQRLFDDIDLCCPSQPRRRKN